MVNELPGTFKELASSGGHRVETEMAAQGSWSLADHVSSTDTLGKLASGKWDFVILQEQSQFPASAQIRKDQMYPAARSLAGVIKAHGATPVFLETWAHRDGQPEYGLPSYAAMQYEIALGYLGLAQELNAPLASVGYAWSVAIQEHPELTLWQDDGSHPSEQGTYLAACVLYATLFNQSPKGLTYHANLSKETAGTIQTLASQVVLNSP